MKTTGINQVCDAVGELIFHNRYSYTNGNPVNFTDHSGMCSENPAWWDIAGNRCWFLAQGLAARFNAPVENFSWMTYEELEVATLKINLVGTIANASILPSLALREDPKLVLQALQEFGCQQGNFSGFAFGTTVPWQELLKVNPKALAIGAGIGIGITVGIGLLLTINAISRSSQVSAGTFEYRLTGFEAKVGTLAEHLSKVLDKEIAGYPRPDPNPENRATRVWCVTIRRVIQEIDGAGYTDKQLARDLEIAGISAATWNAIKLAVKAVADGDCGDHWGNFTGGSLAAG